MKRLQKKTVVFVMLIVALIIATFSFLLTSAKKPTEYPVRETEFTSLPFVSSTYVSDDQMHVINGVTVNVAQTSEGKTMIL